MNQGGRIAFGTLLAGALLSVGCGNDNDFNGYPVPPIGLQAPVAVNDAFGVLGNSQLQAAAPGVLGNDTPNAATPTLQNGPTRGSVTLNPDGSFTYTPNAGQSNVSDSFTYTLNNGFGTSTATVTIQIGAQGFFVKNDAPAGGNGSEAVPFRTLAEAAAAASGVNGAEIVVFRGNGTSAGYNTVLTLQADQVLRGQDPANPPTLTGPVLLSSGNRVQDVRIVGTAGSAINATNASNGVISGVTVDGATVDGVALVNATGTWTVDRMTITNVPEGVDGDADTGNKTWTVSNSVFANTTLCSMCLNLQGNATQTLTFTNNTVNGGGTSLRGIDIVTQGTSQLSARILSNTISGCTAEGLLVAASGNSLAKLRFTNNRTAGNQANNGWRNFNSVAGTLQATYQGNTSDRFTLIQGGGPYQVEDFVNFAAQNTGTLITSGTIQNAAPGSLGIP